MRSSDACAIELRVMLPPTVAAEVEEMSRREPEVLSRILTYGVVRRLMFDRLKAREAEGGGE